MKWIIRLANLLLLAAIASAPAVVSRSAASLSWQSKVDPWVLETAHQGDTEFILFLKEQADLSGAQFLPTKAEKGAYVYEQLTHTAARTQKSLLKTLSAQPGIEFRSYWVANAIWVRGGAAAVQQFALRSDVAHIYANPTVHFDEPLPGAAPPGLQLDPADVEWNIAKVGAPQVWAAGYTGQGVVVAGQDTGYDWEHPALKNQYRGWDGTTANHNYNWHDAIDGIASQVPFDDHYHGTHTMGTIVGDDGGSNKIGMAPGARWIGCRNMDHGDGTPQTYMDCYQWFIAPTDLQNQNPRPDLAPDVINNSWGCPISEGCIDPNVLLTVVNNVRAAGIVTVHSAGNSGYTCGTVNTPAAIYDSSFTVGNTQSDDEINYGSSRGPVTVDGSNRMKPNVSAPGTYVRSSVPGGGYSLATGTSMAAPHVTGLVALMISKDPSLAGQVGTIETLIEKFAVPRLATQDCGDLPGNQVPNNVYGWGRIDAWNTVSHLPLFSLNLKRTTIPEKFYNPGSTITYTIQVTNTSPLSQVTSLVISETIPLSTTLMNATLPHMQVGDLIHWDFPSLAVGSGISVTLVVQVDQNATEPIINPAFIVDSKEVGPLQGPPLYLYYLAHYIYFPLIAR
jgi:serine protease AprX